MSQLEELQGRITAALERIAQGLDGKKDSGADPSELEALQQELADEKLASEQLKERVKSLKQRREALEEQLVQAQTSATSAAEELDGQLQSLRKANEQLREINAELREANESGVVEPHLINKAMMAELEGLRASRAADRAETEAVLAALSEAVDSAQSTDQPENA